MHNSSHLGFGGQIFVLFLMFALLGAGLWYLARAPAPAPDGGIACTADAMQCSDGSWVGRSGPNCEFICPAATTTPPVGGGGGGTACTMEAKQCPDGSYVGRTGPNCEFSACPTGGSILPYNSGIRGTVMAGPTCPVERNPPDPACADKPLQTTVSVSRESDPTHVFAQAHSNQAGAFEVSLPPGSYTVSAGEGMFPRCNEVSATVGPYAYTIVAVDCDTGIR